MLLQKYKPLNVASIVGNKTNIQTIQDWLNTWDQQKKKCLLVSGVSGIGKTLSVELILNQMKYNIINLNSDEERDKEYINATIKPIIKIKKTVFGKKNALLVDDLECTSDYGFLSTLVECIKETNIPIICICNDRYNQSFKTLVGYCADAKFQKPRATEIQKFISDILRKEKFPLSDAVVNKMIDNSNHDIRSILNNLDFHISTKTNPNDLFNSNTNKDNTQMNVFDMTNIMFSQNSDFENKFKTFWMETDLIPLMIHENYIRNSLKNKNEAIELEQISNASDSLSHLDLFQTSIEVTNWELSPYVATSCINATAKCHSKSMVKFPEFLGRTSSKGKKRRTLEEITTKYIGARISNFIFRTDYVSHLLFILFERVKKDTSKGRTTKFVVSCLDMGLNKEDIQDNLYSVLLTDGMYADCKYTSLDLKTRKSILHNFGRIL
jgi:replication factor C subunit 1